MGVVIFILIYLVGCVLSYGRLTASDYDFLEKNNFSKSSWIATNIVRGDFRDVVLIIGSWFAVISGCVYKVINKEKYWFKWSLK